MKPDLKYLVWPDGTYVSAEDYNPADFGHMSDDYEIKYFRNDTEAEAYAASLLSVQTQDGEPRMISCKEAILELNSRVSTLSKCTEAILECISLLDKRLDIINARVSELEGRR